MKGKFFSTILWFGIILMLAMLGASSWIIYSRYQERAAAAIAEHKRVKIELAAKETEGSLSEPKNSPPAETPSPETPPAENLAGGTAGNAAETPPQENDQAGTGKAETEKPALEKPASATATPPTKPAETAAEPKIAIIIADLGLSKSSTIEAMKLPAAVSFSFSPYSANLSEWFQAAKANGNEILLDLPMEPNDYPITDPGPYALLTSLSKEENLGRLKALLALADPNLAGLVATKDEKFSSSVDDLASILKEIKTHSLRLYFTSKNSSSPVSAFANSFDVPIFTADAILDDKITETAINDSLAELEKTARAKGFAIGVARPYPLSVKQLANWMALLPGKGIKLVPASEIGENKAKEKKEPDKKELEKKAADKKESDKSDKKNEFE